MFYEIQELGQYTRNFDTKRFADYVGIFENQSEFYLNAGANFIETIIYKSLAKHKVITEFESNSFIIPFGPIYEIEDVFIFDNNGTKKRASSVNISKENIVINDCFNKGYMIYRTCSVVITPLLEQAVFKASEDFLNGDVPNVNKYRKLLTHYKPQIPHKVKLYV